MKRKVRPQSARRAPRLKPPPAARFQGLVEELEVRLLFSADAATLLGIPVMLSPQVESASTRVVGEALADTATPTSTVPDAHDANAPAGQASAAAQRHEVVFIDASIPNADQLIQDIQAQSGSHQTIDVVVIQAHENGLDRITTELKQRQDLDAVHIISHGDSLNLHLSDIASWGGALTEQADLLLYGCDLAQTHVGRTLVDNLSLLTGADAAASMDKTGAALLGGNWTLEYADGAIEAQIAPSAQAQADWMGLLQASAQGSETIVNTTTTGTQTTATNRQVAMDNNGNYVAIWSTGTAIKGQLFTVGGVKTGSEFSVASGNNAQVAMDDAGNFVVVWDSGNTIYAQRYNASAVAQGGNISVGTSIYPTASVSNPSVAMDDSGNFVVAWRTANVTYVAFDIYFRAYNSGGTALAAGAAVTSAAGAGTNDPYVAMNGSGAFVVTWTDNSGNIHGQRYDAARAAQGSNFQVNTTTTGTQSLSSVAMDNSGNYVVVWSSTQGGTEDIFGQRYNAAGTKVGAEFQVNSTSTDTQTAPSVAMDITTGSFVVTWQSNLQDGSGTGVYMRQYDSTGTASSTDQLVNTTTSGAQGIPSVAVRNHHAAIVWNGSGTGDTTGVFTQRYQINEAPAISSNGAGTTASVSVAENTTAVTTVLATDADGDAVTYAISGGADAAKFSINASSGVLIFVSAPDFETPTDADGNNIYEVTVQASDGTLTDTQAISVTVTDVSSALVVSTTADTNDTGLGASFNAEQLNASKGTDGKVSLREALIAANNTTGTDTISFTITGSTGSYGEYTITATSALPTITGAIVLDASTQSGYVAGGLHTVVLDGNDAAAYGLQFNNTADGSTVRGLLIRNFTAYGIYVESGSDNHTFVGNFIGSFNADGSNKGAGFGNATAGIVTYGANTTIGGTTAADRNVISGNTAGYNIFMATGADGTVIKGNYIGTNSAGTAVFSTTNPNYGVMIESSATNVTIGGTATGAGNVISGHVREGIWVTTNGTVTIQGNYIGTDYTGNVDLGNARYGIYIDDAGTATIGGTAAGAGNVISGNDLGGIVAFNPSITVQGNTIGLNAAGTSALGNTGPGIELRTSNASLIGGNTASARNIISGNSTYGIDIETSPNPGHVIKGNYIGVAANGTTLLGNGAAGIYVNSSYNTIGGKGVGDGNLIAGNGGAGIAVASGVNNLIYRNAIHSNTGLGIDLNNDGVTLNDDNDGDGGANYRTNTPVITSVVTQGGSTTITGSVDWYQGGDTLYIEFFSSSNRDGSGYGEGQTYLGAVQVITTTGSGDATFSLTVAGVSVGDWVSAVTNAESSYIGASEFALAVQAVSPANAPRGRLIWNNNDRFNQYYADWSAAGFSGVGTNGLNLTDDLSMIVAAEAPTRNEILFIGSADASGKILAGIWNGSTWSSVIALPLANPSAAAGHYDSFAVAYDQVSGDAMLVWDNGDNSGAGLSYARWNGSTWSTTSTYTAPVSGEPLHMKLATRPSSQEMVLAVQTSAASDNQYVAVWNGTTWGHAQALGTNTNEQNFELNVAYEQQSGRAVVLYDASASNSASVQYRVWNGSGWGSENTVVAPVGITATSDVYATAMAADPGSNRLAMAVKTADNSVWLSVWDGSAWGSTQVATTSGVSLPEDHPTMAVAFETQTGDLLAVYGKASGPNVYYRTWTSAGGWSAEGTGPSVGGTDIPYVIKLYADPYSNTIMLGVQDNASDLNMAAWDGSAWGSVSTLDSNTGFSYRENFTYVWYHNAALLSNLSGDTLAYTEEQTATPIDQGTAATVTMGDETAYDGGNLTVSFTAGSTISEDVLAVRHQGSGAGQIGLSGANVSYGGTVIGTCSGGSGGNNLVITFNSNATNAAVTALVKNITYQNTNTGTPSTSNRTARFVVNNALGQASANSDVTVTVSAINDAPANTVPGAQSVNEDATLVFSSGNGNLIAISDVDAGNSVVQVTLGITNGTLTLSGTSGLSFSTGDGSGDTNMTFTGTVSAINTALSGLIYSPTANYSGSVTLSLSTSDLGNTGSGGTLTDTDTVAITVNAVNDAPVNSVPAAQATNEDTSLVFSSGNSNLISIADVDAGSGSMQVTIGVGNGTLSLSGTTGLSFSAGDGSFDATMTFTGTVSAINTALAGLIYAPTANYTGSDTLTITTSDQGNTGSGGIKTDTDTVAITVNAVNDAPVNSVPAAQATNEDTSLVFSSGNSNLISIADVDAASGSMQISLSVANGTLSLSGTTGLSFSTGDGSSDATMVFTGTVSAINTALAGLIYAPTANYTGSDTLTITTSDQGNTGSGGIKTDTDTVAITVNAVNDAPVNSVPAAQSTNEDSSLVFSSGNSNLISIADVDAASGSMQVTIGVGNGTLSLSGTTGLSFSAGDGSFDATMTFTGTVSAINTALAGLIYAPTANYTGSDTLTITTSDQGNTGSGGIKTDTDTVAITVNAVNDAPVNSVPAAPSTNENSSLVFSSGNSNLISIADVDAASGSMQVTIGVGNGTLSLSGTTGLSFSVGDGSFDATMTFTGTVSAINTALAGLIYAPTANYNGSDTLTITTSDQGNTGSGGTLSDTDTVAITVNAVNDAPVNSVPLAQTVNEDTNKVFSAANGNLISISDADAGSSSVRVTLGVAHGTLSLAGITGLTFTAGDGTSDATMTFSGTVSAINTALASVTYRGASNYNGADTLTITTSDLGNTGSGGAKTDTDTVAITVNAVNDAPVNTKPGAQNVNEDATLVFSSGNSNLISIADVDAASSAMQVTLTVTNGTLTLSGTSGLSFSVGDGSGDTTMTFTGSRTNINTALAGLSYTPTSNYSGADTLTITTSDQGNTGSGGAKTDTDTVAITVNAVNDAPVATITPVSYTATEQVALTLHGTGLSISDVDAASSTVQVTLSVASGTLTVNAGTTGVSPSGSGTNSITLSGTLNQINDLLAGNNGGTISYLISTDTPPGSDTLTMLVSDLGNTGSGGTLTASDTATLTITAVNDAPTATITAGSYTVVEAQSLVLQNTGLSISDPDGSGTSVQVTLSADIGAITVGAGSTGVLVSGSNSSSVTLTGTVSQINSLLTGSGGATVSYINNSGTPLASAALTLSIDDLGNVGGGNLNASANVAITVIQAATMGSVGIPGIQKTDVAAYYGFDASANLGRDDSGGSHTMTLSGTTSQTTANDGRQSALAISNGGGEIVGLQTGGATTIATWVRFDSTGSTGGDRVVDLGQTNGAGIGNLVIARSGQTDRISFSIQYNGSQYDCTSAAGAVVNGQWLHVAATLDTDGTMKLYVNGALANTVAGEALALGVRDHNYLGQSNSPGTDGLDGAVNDLLIVNKVLDANQIATLHQQANGFAAYERSANGTVIGTVLDSSSVDGRTVSYTLVNSAGGRFAIDAGTGVITVADGASTLYASASSYTITVRGTDSGGDALDTSYTINLSNINDAPLGADHTVTTLEDTDYVFNTADFGFTDANDPVGNNLLAVRITSLPAAGSLTLNGVAVAANDLILSSDIASGLLHFTPDADAHGAGYASFGFRVQDDGGTAHGGVDMDTGARTLTIDVTAVNDAPQGSNQTVTTLEDTPFVLGTSDFGFTDVDGHTLLAVQITSLPGQGSLTLNGNAVLLNDLILASDIVSGFLVWTPDAQANGTAYTSLGFKVQDNGGTSNGGINLDTTARTLTFSVTAVNDAPSGTDSVVTTSEDTDYVFAAADFGFTDVDDTPANTLQAVTFTVLPSAGLLKLNGVALLVGDVVSVADINAGRLTFSPTPDANGTGYATLGFQVQDDGGTANGGENMDASTRTLTIHVTAVNDAPTTNHPVVSGNEDTVITGTVSGADIDGDSLSYAKATDPAHGTVSVAADGSFSYTPTAHYNGADSFTVTVSDGQGGSITSTISITVIAVNDAPTANNPTVSGDEDTVISGAISASDIEGDTLGFTKASDPAHGVVNVAADGSFSYTPTAHYNGTDSFTVTISDGQGGSTTSTISITVNALNDAPTANNPAVSGAEDTVITGQVSGADVDGDSLSYSKASDPTHGSVNVAADGSFTYTPATNYNGTDSFTVTVSDGHGGSTTATITIGVTPVNDAPTINHPSVSGTEDNAVTGQVTGTDVDGDTLSYAKASDPVHGSVTVAADGSFVYTPTANYNGTDSFTITASDGQGGSVTSTITVQLTAVNDAPVANNPAISGAEGTVLTGQITATDTEGDTLVYQAGSDPAHGQIAVASDGSFTYTPDADFHGTDTFTVLTSDGQGGTVTSTVSVTVTPVNDAPTVNGISVSGTEDSVITATVIGADIDGDTLSFSKLTDPSHGSVVVNSDGSFSYTPSAHFNGTDSFTVSVSDGHGGTASATVLITVTPVNDAPSSIDVSVIGAEDTVITGQVSGIDIDGDSLTFDKASNPANGVVTVNVDGSFSYTPRANFTGSDSFTVRVSDGQGGSTLSTVSVTVAPANDAPTTSHLSLTTAEDTILSTTVSATDIDGDTLSFSKASDPLHGVVTVQSDGSFSYSPHANFHGQDTFSVLVSDGHGGTATSVVSIDVTAVNDAPVMTASTLTASAAPGTSWDMAALLNQATDTEGDTLTLRIVQGPQHGQLSMLGNGRLSYTTTTGYVGADTFTYQAYDGELGSVVLRRVDIAASSPVFAEAPGPAPDTTPSKPPAPEPQTPPLPPSPPPPVEASPPSPPVLELPPATNADNSAGNTDERLGNEALHRTILGAAWSGPKSSGLSAMSRPGFVLNYARYEQPPTPGTASATVIQLLEMIQPALERSKDISLQLTPLSAVAHALPQQTGAAPGEAGQTEASTIQLARAASYSTGLGLSIGTIWWTARVSGLITSALISTPAWRSLDPLPVVTSPADEADPDDLDGDDHLGDREVEHLFDADRPLEQDLPIIY